MPKIAKFQNVISKRTLETKLESQRASENLIKSSVSFYKNWQKSQKNENYAIIQKKAFLFAWRFQIDWNVRDALS